MRKPTVADQQAGAFARSQATHDGFARKTIRARIAQGWWIEIAPRVFVERGTAITALTLGWAGHLVTGGVVSHQSAAAVHGLLGHSRPIHVTTRRELNVSERGIVEHRVSLPSTEVEHRAGLPVTSRERTVVDVLATTRPAFARTFLFRSIQQRWIDAPSLDRHIRSRKGTHGIVQLRELAGLIRTGAQSPAEEQLHQILERIDDLRYTANTDVSTGDGAFVVDVLIPEHAIVIEVDGRRYHSSPEQFAHDRRRQNALVNAGLVVLRFTWLDVVERPAFVDRTVRDALAVSCGTKRSRTGP